MLTSSSCTDDIHKTARPIDNQNIGWREDCPDCPGDTDCCCGIELIGNGSGQITICGSSTGTVGFCPAPSGCPSASASICCTQIINLNSVTNPKEPFCINQGQGFWIRNSGFTTITVRYTCTIDETNPTWIQETLDPGDRFSYYPDGSCELVPCG